MPVSVKRYNNIFRPDASRVIARFLYTGDERSMNVIKKVLEMPEDEVKLTISQVLRGFSQRHRNISKIFEKHFNQITHLFDNLDIKPEDVDLNRKVLIGSYFTMEYSIESAAFFNPSMVVHPDQSELAPKELRVIISFRATGEGHISSLVFRTGVLDKDNNLALEEAGQLLDEAEVIKRFVYDKESFMKMSFKLSLFLIEKVAACPHGPRKKKEDENQ